MSDIFVSYARRDRNRVSPLIEALEKTGWTIFWDTSILGGIHWRPRIHAELQACRCMLVVWTHKSVNREWVLNEAEIGKKREVLVPVLLDDVEPPFGFGEIQAVRLLPWNDLIAAIENILGRAPATAPPPEFPTSPKWNQPKVKLVLNALDSFATKSSALFRRIVGTIVATFVISVILVREFDRHGIYLPVHRIGLIVLITVSIVVLTISRILSWFKRRRKNEYN